LRDNLRNRFIRYTYIIVYHLPRSTGSRCERVNIITYALCSVYQTICTIAREGLGAAADGQYASQEATKLEVILTLKATQHTANSVAQYGRRGFFHSELAFVRPEKNFCASGCSLEKIRDGRRRKFFFVFYFYVKTLRVELIEKQHEHPETMLPPPRQRTVAV